MNTSRDFAEYAKKMIDCVNITSSQLKDLNHIAIEENGRINPDVKRGFYVEQVVLPNFALVVDGGDSVFTFEKLKTPVQAENDEEWTVSASHGDDTIIGIMTMCKHCLRAGVISGTFNSKHENEYIVGLACVIFSAIQNRLLNPLDNFEVEEKKVQNKRKSKKHQGKGQRKVRLYKSYTLVRVEPITRPHKSVKITCPCWGVRGHYRHYSSGKVIFISAYQKGKNRSSFSPKEYEITRKDITNENHRTIG